LSSNSEAFHGLVDNPYELGKGLYTTTGCRFVAMPTVEFLDLYDEVFWCDVLEGFIEGVSFSLVEFY